MPSINEMEEFKKSESSRTTTTKQEMAQPNKAKSNSKKSLWEIITETKNKVFGMKQQPPSLASQICFLDSQGWSISKICEITNKEDEFVREVLDGAKSSGLYNELKDAWEER